MVKPVLDATYSHPVWSRMYISMPLSFICMYVCLYLNDILFTLPLKIANVSTVHKDNIADSFESLTWRCVCLNLSVDGQAVISDATRAGLRLESTLTDLVL